MKVYTENDPVKAKTMVKQASESLFVCIYLENSDHYKYGLIIQNMNSQKSLVNYQYP